MITQELEEEKREVEEGDSNKQEQIEEEQEFETIEIEEEVKITTDWAQFTDKST